MARDVNTFHKLIQERQVIQANASRIEDLSQDLVNLANLQEASLDITPCQSNFVNEKRINLRNNIVNLKKGLQIHYDLGEMVLLPLVSFSLLQMLVVKHRAVLRKLSDLDVVILNLSPLGILFNSVYIKYEISAIFLVLHDLNCQENSPLAFSGITRNEEAL